MLPDDIDALPDLASLHSFVADTFLTRHNDELQELKADRRPGRPPQKREIELKEIVAKELQEYNEGLELPDFYERDQRQAASRMARRSASTPSLCMVRISGKYRVNAS